MVKFKEKKAVTVIELIVVLAIMGIISLAAIAKVGSYDSLYLEAATQRLLSDLRYVRDLAMTNSDGYYGLRFQWLDWGSLYVKKYNSYFSDSPSLSNQEEVNNPFYKEPREIYFDNHSANGQSAQEPFRGVKIEVEQCYSIGMLLYSDIYFDSKARPYIWDPASNSLSPATAGINITLRYQEKTKSIHIEPETGTIWTD